MRQRNQRGVILLLVLVAILVVGVALTTTARRSLLASTAAIDAQQSLQRRWGVVSCRQTILRQAEGVFSEIEGSRADTRRSQTPFVAMVSDRVLLGGQNFDLIIADEDAKANLNSIYHSAGLSQCEQAATTLIGPFDRRMLQLRPETPSAATPKPRSAGRLGDQGEVPTDTNFLQAPAAFRSWGEIFDLVAMNAIAGDDRQLAALTRRMTLFGRGRMNVFRASDEAVLAVCGSVVQDGLGRRLLERMRQSSLRDIALVLDQVVTNVEDRARLKQLFANGSSCFSLWIETTNGQSRQQYFAVRVPDERGTIRTIESSYE